MHTTRWTGKHEGIEQWASMKISNTYNITTREIRKKETTSKLWFLYPWLPNSHALFSNSMQYLIEIKYFYANSDTSCCQLFYIHLTLNQNSTWIFLLPN